MNKVRVKIVGGGLAGCEAAWQIAKRDIKVDLYEMRPYKTTPAHHTRLLAELVCSNSLRSNIITNAAGLLKEEMRHFDSLIIRAADATRLPAGSALAVDREKFAEYVTRTLTKHPNVTINVKEMVDIPEYPAIVATGPLTSERLSKTLKDILGDEHLYFYDAAAPIIMADSVDLDKAFWASRYDKGENDYANIPLTEEEYFIFYNELVNAEVHMPRKFETPVYFEGCMPIEVMAKRGPKTLLFGPLKPKGLIDPRTHQEPFAVVQLRKDNKEGTLLNVVGFQTSLKWPEQKRVFGMIPGLQNVEFARYGFIHRNTFINSPIHLLQSLELKKIRGIFFAGQITGVEGYIESAASGIVAGINAARFVRGEEALIFPEDSLIGALCSYITSSNLNNFQPMKSNFGILPPLNQKIKSRQERNRQLALRALDSIKRFVQNNDLK
ncbi:MAG: methylenetetrahydrofolate--tRNA-(uracil(54)-C(5))-methyltransferase (FADH(2)-oxidizing) TrmFO [Tepidanaerobacteraceae bacterium]